VIVIDEDDAERKAVHVDAGIGRDISECAATLILVNGDAAFESYGQVVASIVVVIAGGAAQGFTRRSETGSSSDIGEISTGVAVKGDAARASGKDQVLTAITVVIDETGARPKERQNAVGFGGNGLWRETNARLPADCSKAHSEGLRRDVDTGDRFGSRVGSLLAVREADRLSYSGLLQLVEPVHMPARRLLIAGELVSASHAEFGGHSIILLPDEEGRIALPSERAGQQALPDADISVAQWVFDHETMAGNGTDTLPGAAATYFPLSGLSGPLGVLAVKPANLRRVFLPEQRRLMDTFLGQIAQALERVRLAEEASAAQRRMESETLRNSLLSAISHDLRTPLASIVGAASTLAEEGAKLGDAERTELSRAIHEEALRMCHLTSNILDMARLDTGPVHLNRQWCPLDEIVGGALTRLGERLKERPVKMTLPQGLSLVFLDAALVEQLLVNLLDNALKYTPAGTPIEIGAELSAFSLILSVADRGPGIPKGEEDKLFDKFYRLRKEEARSGVGLGLAICKAIADVHGGIVQASNRGGGGALFRVILPMNETPPPLGDGQESP